ncbi:transformer-2 protein homolog alpha isoform X3 [Folsomia candida]|nr:transformer-2 protein homolog alpha isoform X3 [Folsomia candida]
MNGDRREMMGGRGSISPRMGGSPGPVRHDRSGSHREQHRYSRSRSHSRGRERKNYRRGYRSRSRSRLVEGGGGGGGGGARSRSRSPMSGRRRQDGGRKMAVSLKDDPQPNKCLGVFGLSLRTTERDLKEVFSRYGPIDECTVVIDAQTGRSRGFAFIYFESMEDAKAAKESCNGIEIDGRRIRVDFSITQRAHTPTPGIYMGKPTYDDSVDRRSRGGRREEYNRGYNRRSPSPYYRRRGRYSRSRSREYSPR